jgi:hypothetical protein
MLVVGALVGARGHGYSNLVSGSAQIVQSFWSVTASMTGCCAHQPRHEEGALMQINCSTSIVRSG